MVASLLHFYSGQPLQNLSGVDTFSGFRARWANSGCANHLSTLLERTRLGARNHQLESQRRHRSAQLPRDTSRARVVSLEANFKTEFVGLLDKELFWRQSRLRTQSVDVSVSTFGFPCPFAVEGTGGDTKFTGGLLAGYNWQYGNQVYGIEGDINFLSDFDFLASIRGRYGVIYNDWLYYGTAGVSFINSGTNINSRRKFASQQLSSGNSLSI